MKASQELVAYKLSCKFGWTPEQIGKMDGELVDLYLAYMNIEAQFKSGDTNG